MTIQFADHLKDIPDYIPGKPLEELERELGIREAIKMASNENFWGPPEKVSDAIFDKIKELNFYPDTACFLLRSALSKKLGVQVDQIIIGNGSNYLIELICRSVLNPGSEAITCPPTFAFYGRAIRGAIGKNKMIQMKNFDVDLDNVLKGVTDRTRLIILASPNNPTGKIIPFVKFKWFMGRVDRKIGVLLDEAYIHYVTSKDAGTGLDILKDYENLIVLRTFSKIYSLAGLRLGFAIAHPTLIQTLMKLFLPFSVGMLSQVAALASLGDESRLDEIRRINEEGKKYFYRELEALGIEFVPTEANFILVRVGQATRVYEKLLKRGIIVRDMTPWKLPDHIRVTISLPEHNEHFIRELKTTLANR
jgi:histidinol-phosphate aminotransferase